MTYIKYDETKPFETTLVEIEDEVYAMSHGYIRAGQFEVNLINSGEGIWFNHHFDLTRDVRKKLLEAFDIYSKNVNYGVETETEEEHKEVINWRKNLLDLSKTAFINIPERIKYYLK